jgi:hypothetical protein
MSVKMKAGWHKDPSHKSYKMAVPKQYMEVKKGTEERQSERETARTERYTRTHECNLPIASMEKEVKRAKDDRGYREALPDQNTVPSERIMIGGSLVFGLDTSANSLPPYITNRSVFASEKRMVRLAYLPSTRLQHLSQRQSIALVQSQQLVDLGKQEIQESQSRSSPFNNDVIVGCEHRNNLHVRLTGQLRIFVESLDATLGLLGFQRQKPCIDKQTAVPILGQSGEQVFTGENDTHQLRHRYQQ